MRDHTASLIENFAALSRLEDCALSPDGRTLAYTRHVDSHHQIFALPIERGGEVRITATLDDCTEPQYSPDGQHLVYVREHALWIANADGSNARELTNHPGGNTHPRWSPDGSRIAFLSRRRGWSHIWTIAASELQSKQITRGEFDVCNPTWSQDGKCLAYDSWRTDDIQTRAVYLITSNGGEELVSVKGSWSGAPSFSPDGRTLAFLSDQTGWFHIYLYDTQLRITHQLTRGEFEDGGSHFYDIDPRGGPLFSPDGKQIAFVRHREGKIDVWVVDVATGDAKRISSIDGRHRLIGWLPDSKHIAAMCSQSSTPGDVWLLSTDSEPIQLIDSSIAELKSRTHQPEWIAYPSPDDLKIPAALLRPLEKTKAPAVVFIHGGPNSMFGDDYYPLPQILAQEGYVVLLPNYRGSTGYGNVFRNANMREWGNADAMDIVYAARWLKSQSFVDPDRIAVVGPSYGGYLALSALTLAPELFCAGVDMYGDSEIAEAYHHEDREARMDLLRHMGTPEENAEGYRRGSPLYQAEKIQAPLLLLHGKDDQMVAPLMSEKMIAALKIENKYVESHFYDGEEHGFDKPENKKDAWERIVKFLNRFCRDEK
ncbi:MAG: S9 family peptidase [Chloroflexi bacterium]|nr:S9 family peptidase [Chloroflexota bacterium]